MSWREWPRCPWSVGVAVAPALGGGVRQEALEQLRCSVPLGLPCPSSLQAPSPLQAPSQDNFPSAFQTSRVTLGGLCQNADSDWVALEQVPDFAFLQSS